MNLAFSAGGLLFFVWTLLYSVRGIIQKFITFRTEMSTRLMFCPAIDNNHRLYSSILSF
jgi:hypothetical protein